LRSDITGEDLGDTFIADDCIAQHMVMAASNKVPTVTGKSDWGKQLERR